MRTVRSGLQSFFFLVCVDFLSRQLDVLLTGFVVDGIPYAYIIMYFQAYVWCVSVDNEYIGGVCAVGSGLHFFFDVHVDFLSRQLAVVFDWFCSERNSVCIHQHVFASMYLVCFRY